MQTFFDTLFKIWSIDWSILIDQTAHSNPKRSLSYLPPGARYCLCYTVYVTQGQCIPGVLNSLSVSQSGWPNSYRPGQTYIMSKAEKNAKLQIFPSQKAKFSGNEMTKFHIFSHAWLFSIHAGKKHSSTIKTKCADQSILKEDLCT